MKLIKEIADYQKLREDMNTFTFSHGDQAQAPAQEDEYTVYKATGKNTAKVFYGWIKGTGEDAIRKSFMVQANRQGDDAENRGVQVLIAANGGNPDEIEFEELAIVDSSIDAHQLRNDERAADPESVTDPSALPAQVHAAAKAKYPERHAKIQRYAELKKCSTARQAYAGGFFTKDQIMGLKGHPEAKTDLDKLTPFEFSKKYDRPFVV